MSGSHLFTSECVTMGHPDKLADQISDAILDEMLKQDKSSHVACETLVTTGLAFVAGEITTEAYVDIPGVIRRTIEEVGYVDANMGADAHTCAVVTSIDEQSGDIAMGVDREKPEDQGAGDQGMMFGYACNETDVLMPLPIHAARRITSMLAEKRFAGEIKWLRPDGKSQVTIEYEHHKPRRVHTVVVSTQHTPDVSNKEIRETVIEEIIKPAVPAGLIDKNTIYHVNPTGRFVLGGPHADCGLTGRKIIVDTYGGVGSHGGGAFSGKDPSKVDRSAAYMARHIAKHIVAAGAATHCELQVAYAIGVAEPVSLTVDTQGTGKVEESKIAQAIREVFPLKPYGIIEYLDLLRPIYKKTAKWGHFGIDDDDYTWEKLAKLDELKAALKL
ncbi:MAG: methionine adenosyltransferase [Planctomycetes bacterium]|nr:methionine adenosyltransferase [Planctomycetota bacterium]